MIISIFGNPDLAQDAMPIALLPALRKEFPDIEFIHQDPNELGQAPSNPWIIIDTVKGLKKVTVIDDIDSIKVKHRVSMHDYDLSMHLALVKKIDPNLQIRIIGIPMGMGKEDVSGEVVKILDELTKI